MRRSARGARREKGEPVPASSESAGKPDGPRGDMVGKALRLLVILGEA